MLRELSLLKVKNGKLIKEFPAEVLDKKSAGLNARLRALDDEEIEAQNKINRISSLKKELNNAV